MGDRRCGDGTQWGGWGGRGCRRRRGRGGSTFSRWLGEFVSVFKPRPGIFIIESVFCEPGRAAGRLVAKSQLVWSVIG